MGLFIKFLFSTAVLGLMSYGLKYMGESYVWGAFTMLIFWQVIFRLKNGYWFEP